MNESYIRNILEAAMLAAGKSLTLAELGQLFDEGARPKTEEVRAALDALAAEYAGRGIEVKETAAGFRIQVRREFSGEISRLWPERPARYSRALLETLALIAYRQPITRAEIEAVRGVAVNPNIIKTVIERNWVRVVGHRDVPGRPELLGTTREFLDYFGLRSLDELPPLADLKAMGEYNLQLELPNAGALGVEAGDGPVGDGQAVDGAAIPVAALTHEAGDAIPTAAEAGTSEAAASEAAASEAGASEEGAASTNGNGAANEVAAAATDDAANEVAAAATDGAANEFDKYLADATSVAPISSDGDATSAESDDPEASETMVAASEPVEALDDASDDEADDDELSADGHASRELVAGPHDHND